MKFFTKINDAFSTLRYGSVPMKTLYWFYRVAIILVPVLVVAVIVGLIYCSVNGITIVFGM